MPDSVPTPTTPPATTPPATTPPATTPPATTPPATTPPPKKASFLPVAALLIVAAILGVGWLAPGGWNYAIVFALMCVFFIFLGVQISGRPLGILVNHRNLMSLSRFQIVLWTLAIGSGYLTMAVVRVKAWLTNPASVPDPVAIGLDQQLWALMGISATSLVATPLILSTKTTKQPDQAAVDKTAKIFGQETAEVNKDREGTLYSNPEISDARFTDMFEGDEIGNTAHVDLSKVQMFFFTLVAVGCYGIMLFNLIRTKSAPELGEFPKVSDGLVALLGISHAGYLGKKVVNETK